MRPAVWIAAVAVTLRMATGTAVVRGVVRAADTGEPIPGVSLAIPDAHIRTRSDSAGAYTFTLMAPGTYRVWVSRLGYRARWLDLVVDSAMTLVVDVALSPEPVQLARVAVVGSHEEDGGAPVESAPPFEVGARRFAGKALHANPALGEADALAVLATTAGVTTVPGSPTSLHVRGGAGDQNRVLLDGIPLYNPYHVGGTLSSLGADAISSVTLQAGVAPAQYGDALSSVISLRTADVRPERFSARGGIGASGIRQTMSAPLPWAHAWLLVSGRRSLGDVYAAAQGEATTTAYSDVFGKATLRLGPGTLEMFGFGSGDRLGFDARIDQQSLGGIADTSGGGSSSAANAAGTVARNVFRWSSGTQAAVWTAGDSGSAMVVVRGWHSSTHADVAWASTAGPLILANALSSSGFGARVVWASGATQVTTGVDLERLRNTYRVRSATGAANAAIAAFALATDAPELSVFGEGRWRLTDRWTARVGLRAPFGAGQTLDPEPRVVLGFAASPRVTLVVGYARMHQRTQSLRNDESLLSSLFGIALPVTGRPGASPVARSDQITAAMHALLDHGVTLTVDGYVRRLAELLLVAPATGQPFATTGFDVGTGQASGVGVSATRSGARWWGAAAYSLGTSTRRSGTQHYRPGYGISQQFSLAAARQVGAGTTLRAALWGMVGRPGTVSYGDFQWSPAPITHGAGDVAGSPQQFVGPIGSARLAAYWQVDVGVRHRWRHPRLIPMLGDVTGTLSIENLFDRGNVLATAASPNALVPYTITLPSRALVVGLAWAY